MIGLSHKVSGTFTTKFFYQFQTLAVLRHIINENLKGPLRDENIRVPKNQGRVFMCQH